jgi:hypothetical protein
VAQETLDRAAVLGEPPDHLVRRADQRTQARAISAQHPEHAARFLQRRVRAPYRGVEVVAAGGEAGAELVEQQREPLVGRRAERRVDEVDVDRRVRVGQRDRRRLTAVRAKRRALRGARRALDELLADQRLRLDRAVGVAAERRELLADPHLDARLVLRRELDVDDAAGLRPGDLHVLAGDQERGVVEDRVDAVVAALRTAAARRAQRQPGEHRAQGRRRSREAPHGLSCGLHCASGASNGFDLSGAACDAAPGQRLTMPWRNSLNGPGGGVGSSDPALLALVMLPASAIRT